MRRSLFVRVGVVTCSTAAVVAGVTLAPSAGAVRAGAAPAAAAAKPAVRALTSSSLARSALLPTGETVVEQAHRGRTAQVKVLGAAAHDVEVLTLPGHTYALPKTAIPYIGRGLDLALFDTAALSSVTRVPVRLTYSGAVPKVPGVTVTSSGRGSASGYLTATSARAFGAALARQYEADRKARFPHRPALFGARTITLADGTRAASPRGATQVKPGFVMRTLSIKAVGDDGKPLDFAVVILFNVEEGARYANLVFVQNGEARVSVPDGTYAALGDVSNKAGLVIDSVEGFEVRGPGQTLTLDARRATAQLSVTTPRPAATTVTTFEWDRSDAAQTAGFGAGFFSFGAPIRVTPQPEPELGELYSSSSFNLAGRPRRGLAYTYDAAYPARGVPAQQRHVLRPSELAEVDARYYVDGTPRNGAEIRLGLSTVLPVGGSGGAEGRPLPTRRREYVLAAPGLVWDSSLFTTAGSSFDTLVFVEGGLRQERAGTTRVEEWLRGPLSAKVPYTGPAEAALWGAQCLACRGRDQLLALLTLGDSDAQHTILLMGRSDGKPVTRFRAYKGGVLLADQPDALGVQLTVPPQRATYRFVEGIDRRSSGDRLSTGVTTDVTTVSAATGGGALPANVYCGLGDPCTALSLLQAEVTLPADSIGVVGLGHRRIHVHLGHSQWSAAARVTGARVEVRVAGGRWQVLPLVASGRGAFDALLTTTRTQAGRFVDLRVTGTDSLGGRLVQTTSRAFVLAR